MVSAGELRIEVGVALQRPAEFVIIKIGQIDGGATVTTSI
jgi:phage tail sheath protein FI